MVVSLEHTTFFGSDKRKGKEIRTNRSSKQSFCHCHCHSVITIIDFKIRKKLLSELLETRSGKASLAGT